ncbi:MAG: VanW family protein [Candidatus Gracilibacteria bacterium]|nr:VanW family protein [Candidatus Gracilibacteria bacterium]
MSDILLLSAPSKKHSIRRKNRRKVGLGILGLFLLILLFGSLSTGRKEIVANIMIENPPVLDEESTSVFGSTDIVIAEKNNQLIDLFVDGEMQQQVSLRSMGLEFSRESILSQLYPQKKDTVEKFIHGSADADSLHALLLQDNLKKESFLKQLRSYFEIAAVPEFYGWTEADGWTFHRHERGIVISEKDFESSYSQLVSQLEYGNLDPQIEIQTSSLAPKRNRSAIKVYQRILQMVRDPFVFDIAGKEVTLDLESDKDFLIIEGEEVRINTEKIDQWVDDFVDSYFEEPSRVRLIATETTTYKRNKAVIEGEFREGKRLDAQEIKNDMYAKLFSEDKRIVVRSYEIPVSVYSDLDGQMLEILAVGWSEYSKGNDANRVHNIQTGLDRLNGVVVAPGEKLSFNHMTGPINYDFKEGYAIFGNSAAKSLGGGICQVSTTFFRSLLNIGLPITMRQNHSWDLSYYQAGGYGLDATIYPSQGLDVKAINDYDSHLFFYSYSRPDTEEAFVVVYGVPDGREVALNPRKEYKPFYGAKTLIWDHEVTYADGKKRDYEIVSRYNK